ncbi:MAG: ABC transporter substrate-binding protein [Cumulibacter sp.]
MRVPYVRSIRRYSAGAFAVALVLAGTACGTSDPGQQDGEAPTSLTLATSFAIDDVDPMTNGFWFIEFGAAELLMRPVLAAEPEPWLLQELQNVDDHTWVLTLNEGTAFQNGNPLDGEALAAVMNYDLENVPGLQPLAGTTVEATGEREVTVTTAKPTPNLPYLLADESKFVIFDLAAYEAAGEDVATLDDAQIYTGPYVVDTLDPQTMTMSADDDYWGGTPPLETVTVKFIEEAQSRILAVQNGEADLALYPPTDSAKSIEGRTDAYWITGTPKGPTFQFRMNQKTGVLTDGDVRQALLAAIDYDEIADDVMNGLYEVSHGMYSPQAPYYQDMFDTDLDTAEQLLADAGWAEGADGTRSKDGEPLLLNLLTFPQQPDSETLALAVQAQLADIGITVEIQQVPDIDEAEQDPNVNWQLAPHSNGSTSFSGDPTTTLQSTFASDGDGNHSGIDDPELDALIDEYATTMDPEARDAVLGEIQTVIADNAYMGWLGMRIPGIVAGPAWQDYEIPMANLWVGFETTP